MDPQNLMTTLQQLSNLSGANLTSLNQFGNELSSFPWAANNQGWLDSAAKMAAMCNIIQTASVNDQVQHNMNVMNSFEQSLKLLSQQGNVATQPQHNMEQFANVQASLQNRLSMETMLQNDAISSFIQNNFNQQQVSTPPSTSENNSSSNLAHLFMQNTMSTILGLSNEQDILNAAANQLNNLQGLSSKSMKKASEESQQKASSNAIPDQPSTSQLSAISNQNNLSTTKPSNGLVIDELDLNDIHEIFSDRHQQKPTSSRSSLPTQKQTNEPDLDLDHLASMVSNNEFDFDFNETANHIEKSFDPFNFLKEMSGADRYTPEPTFNQAELEPVQFTPPDSPQYNQQIAPKLDIQQPSTSGTPLINMPLLEKPHKLKASTSMDMPLVFIPPVKETAINLKKLPDQTTKKSSLLARPNKVPIYKQKFISQASETKGEDCYSFVDDEFELAPPLKASTSFTEKSGESSLKSNDRNPYPFKRIAQSRDQQREPRSYGTPWSQEYVKRIENQPRWICVNPFESREFNIDEAVSEQNWETNRAPAKKNSLRVVIKEEPAVENANSEEAARPRIVLKFIKPKADELIEEESVPFNKERRHSNSKKHKKHKRKERDSDWELYPGQSKRHKKEKKHRHKHHHQDGTKFEEIDADNESHPAYHTRSAISVKTENLDSSPTHSNHSFLMDDAFNRRYKSFTQTQSDLPKGVFVVAKEDVWSDECPIWRIDSQNLLQKFLPCHDSNPGCYMNTPNYTGWCDELSHNYIIINVEFLKHTRAETIVKPLHPLDTLLPALTNEDSSTRCFNEEGPSLTSNPSGEYVSVIESVVELLLRQCANPATLEEVNQTKDSKNFYALNEFKRKCLECIDEIQIEETIRTDIQMLLDHYNGLITFDNYCEDDECLSCGEKENLLRLGLHSDEKYDQDLLIPQARNDEIFGHSMDIAVCKNCLVPLEFYHRNRHALYCLFKRCEDQFINLVLEKPAATSSYLLNTMLRNRPFINEVTNDIVNLWSRLRLITKKIT